MFFVAGSWSITNQKVTVVADDSETSSSTISTDYNLKYLRSLSDTIWVGPIFNVEASSVSSDGDKVVIRTLIPGLELRAMLATQGNGYFALGANAGWAFASLNSDISDTSISGSFDGFYKSAYVSVGNRVGESAPYLVEALFGFSHVPVSGKLESVKLKETDTKFFIALGIGRMF